MLVPERFRDKHAGHLTDFSPSPRAGDGHRPGIIRAAQGRTEFPAEISLSSFETAEGPLTSAQFGTQERRRVERAREQLASIVDYSDDAIVASRWTEPSPREQRSRAALWILSRRVIGQPISILLPPDRPDELSESFRSSSREKSSRRRPYGCEKTARRSTSHSPFLRCGIPRPGHRGLIHRARHHRAQDGGRQTTSQPGCIARALRGSAGLFLILTPDLKIVNASDAYLEAAMIRREDLIGRASSRSSPTTRGRRRHGRM